MRFIPTRIHGVMDYVLGVLLIAAPWVLNFEDAGIGTWLPVALGVGVILYSLLTDYELGVVHAISMPLHLMLDAGGGLLLAVSPWLFGFAETEGVWIPHLVVGLLEIGAALMTHTAPSYALRGGGARQVPAP